MINVQEVMEARKKVEEAERELCLIVKEYFELNRIFCIDVGKEKDIPASDARLSFTFCTEEANLEIKVLFEDNQDEWLYKITCKEIGVFWLRPPMENSLTIQGELMFEYTSLADEKRKVYTLEMCDYCN